MPVQRISLRNASAALVCLGLLAGPALGAQAEPPGVTLAGRAGPGSTLKAQDLRFDASHAVQALAYLESGDPAALKAMAALPAVEHLLRHARKFAYDVPRETPEALAAYLVAPGETRARAAAVCARSLAYFQGPMTKDPTWVADILGCLPEDFRFHGTLFLTFRYDIGVAEGPTASLNGAHRCFGEHPRELVYYAIHELHHVGFMAYHPAKPVSAIRTYADLADWVRYATQLEGMAVWTAYPRRKAEGALAQDGMGDYLALDDGPRMRGLEDQYVRMCKEIEAKGDLKLEPGALDHWFEAFSKERLWYRVGAHMARRIEAVRGRPALAALVKAGPAPFLAAYRGL